MSDHAAERRGLWTAAVESGDPARYAELVAEDVVWIPPSGPPLRGRAAFRQWLAPFMGSFEYRMELRPRESGGSGQWAWERGDFVSSMRPSRGGDEQKHGGRYFVLWRRGDDGAWRIDRYVDVGSAQPPGGPSAVAPPPATPPS